MSDKSARELLSESLLTNAIELFAHYEAPLEVGAPPDMELAAVLGFSGDAIQGALGLLAHRDLVAATYRSATGQDGSRRQLDDWLGELANQLLGRIKNTLLRYDVAIQLATPMVLRGVNIEVGGSHEDGVYKVEFTCCTGGLCAWIDAQHEGELVLHLREEEDVSASEGDGMFFF